MNNAAIQQIIEEKIFLVRGQKIMLDRDLAELYGVEVKRLNEQVKRNIKRFPSDFMFQLALEEDLSLRSQIATSSGKGWGGRRYLPYAFTEQGVAMLSSVLNSDKAVEVNIEIMRAFIRLRQILSEHKELVKKIEELEKNYDRQFRIIFEVIRELRNLPEKPKRQIGFREK